MSLSASRLNTARYGSVLADIQAQFPLPGGLQSSEQAQYAAYQQKMAHAISDHEGTDVVTEITTNAVVPFPIAVTIPSTASAGSASTGATTAAGTVS